MPTHCGYEIYPFLPIQGSTSPAFSSVLIDADGETMAFIIQAPKSGNIHTIGVRTGLVTTGGDIQFRVETLDASGDPSGTLYGTNTFGTYTFLATDDNIWKEVTLTADAAVTAGDYLAILVKRPTSGTFAGNFAVPSQATTGWSDFFHSSYHDFNGTGAFVKNNSSVTSLGIKYDDGVAYHVIDMVPASGWSAITYNSGSTPDEYGNRFRLPWSVSIVGACAAMDADGDFKFVLYDDSWNQIAITNTQLAVARSQTSQGRHLGIFTAPYTLAANTWYRCTILPTSVTSLSIRKVTVDSQGWLAQMGAGTDYYLTSRTDAASPSDSTVDRVIMSLYLDSGSISTGGSFTPPNPIVLTRASTY